LDEGKSSTGGEKIARADRKEIIQAIRGGEEEKENEESARRP